MPSILLIALLALMPLCRPAEAQEDGAAERFDSLLRAAALDPGDSGAPPITASIAVPADVELDIFSQPVTPETRAAYRAFLIRHGKLRLTEKEKAFILGILNLPKPDSRTFKDNEALLGFFLQTGVRISPDAKSGLREDDLSRLVRAARAAYQAYDIPAPIVLCLTFRESSFNPRATNWTTSAKGLGQLTNAAVAETIAKIESIPAMKSATASYARLLGAEMPSRFVGAPDVDALNAEIARLEKQNAPAASIAEKKTQKLAAIRSHKDEPGHIFNLETNFGLAAAYMTYLHDYRFQEVSGEREAWLTAVAAYNQGTGTANELIYKIFSGPTDYNNQAVENIFNRDSLSRLSIPPERQEELFKEIEYVDRCSRP